MGRRTAQRTLDLQTRNLTGKTPFSLTYGVEAMILLEIGLPTLRTEEFNPENNKRALAKDLDLTQERRNHHD